MDDIINNLRSQVHTHIVGRNLIYRPSVTSTNDVVLKLAAAGAPEGTVVLAGEQTAGRGRLQRTWLSPRGNIAFSVLLYPTLERLPYLIMVSSLAVARAIESAAGVTAGIKWPNDVQVNGRKVCGILIENHIRDRDVRSVIGIGINVGTYPADLPSTATSATSLEQEAGRSISKADLLAALFAEMDRLYTLLPGRPGLVYRAWQRRLVTLGKPVKVISGTEVIIGVAEDVNRDGSLRLRLPDGSVTVVVCGDVSLRDGTSPSMGEVR